MNTENQPNEVMTEQTPASGGTKTFTQDDVNRIVQERLAKDRAKAESDLNKREQELAQREFRLNNRQKLIDRGWPESVMEALNCSDEAAFDKSLKIIEDLLKEHPLSPKQAELEAKRAKFTVPTLPHQTARIAVDDSIRKAMKL